MKILKHNILSSNIREVFTGAVDVFFKGGSPSLRDTSYFWNQGDSDFENVPNVADVNFDEYVRLMRLIDCRIPQLTVDAPLTYPYNGIALPENLELRLIPASRIPRYYARYRKRPILISAFNSSGEEVVDLLSASEPDIRNVLKAVRPTSAEDPWYDQGAKIIYFPLANPHVPNNDLNTDTVQVNGHTYYVINLLITKERNSSGLDGLAAYRLVNLETNESFTVAMADAALLQVSDNSFAPEHSWQIFAGNYSHGYALNPESGVVLTLPNSARQLDDITPIMCGLGESVNLKVILDIAALDTLTYTLSQLSVSTFSLEIPGYGQLGLDFNPEVNSVIVTC